MYIDQPAHGDKNVLFVLYSTAVHNVFVCRKNSAVQHIAKACLGQMIGESLWQSSRHLQ